MGQKTHPLGFRLGITKDWSSHWYAGKNYAEKVMEDYKIRALLKERLSRAGLASIQIERSFNDVKVVLAVSRPGVVIGRGGSGIELLRVELGKLVGGKPEIEVVEVKDADLNAALVADNIVHQLEKRKPFRRVMKTAAEKVMAKGALGVKIGCKGLIGGTKIARAESIAQGSIPLQRLRSNIDYASTTANTPKGTIGIKVWIYLGEEA